MEEWKRIHYSPKDVQCWQHQLMKKALDDWIYQKYDLLAAYKKEKKK